MPRGADDVTAATRRTEVEIGVNTMTVINHLETQLTFSTTVGTDHDDDAIPGRLGRLLQDD